MSEHSSEITYRVNNENPDIALTAGKRKYLFTYKYIRISNAWRSTGNTEISMETLGIPR